MKVHSIYVDTQVKNYNDRLSLMSTSDISTQGLQKDLDARIAIMQSLVISAVAGLGVQRAEDASRLKIMTFPEFFFQPVAGSYPSSIDTMNAIFQGLMTVIEQIANKVDQNGVSYQCSLKNWVFLLGSVNNMFLPKKYDGDFATYIDDVKSAKEYIFAENVSVCVSDQGKGFAQGGNLQMVAKRYNSEIDYGNRSCFSERKDVNGKDVFIQEASFLGQDDVPLGLWSYEKGIKLPIIPYSDSDQYDSKQVLGAVPTGDKDFFVGVTICLDYTEDKIGKTALNKPTLMLDTGKPIKCLALLSAGMRVTYLPVDESFGNYPDCSIFINNDGLRSSDRCAAYDRYELFGAYYYGDYTADYTNNYATALTSEQSALFKAGPNLYSETYNGV